MTVKHSLRNLFLISGVSFSLIWAMSVCISICGCNIEESHGNESSAVTTLARGDEDCCQIVQTTGELAARHSVNAGDAAATVSRCVIAMEKPWPWRLLPEVSPPESYADLTRPLRI